MKTLLLCRHAEARRGVPGTGDHGRPLSERGEGDARRTGRRLRREGLVPDLVLTSTATRARDTGLLAARAGGFAGRAEAVPELYGAGAEECLDLVHRRGGEHVRLMLVGHNPTLQTLVERLGGRRRGLPTGTVAVIEADVASWEELEPATSRLAAVLVPEEDG